MRSGSGTNIFFAVCLLLHHLASLSLGVLIRSQCLTALGLNGSPLLVLGCGAAHGLTIHSSIHLLTRAMIGARSQTSWLELGHDCQATDLKFPQSCASKVTFQDSWPFPSLSLGCVVSGGLEDLAGLLKASLRHQGVGFEAR